MVFTRCIVFNSLKFFAFLPKNHAHLLKIKISSKFNQNDSSILGFTKLMRR